MKFSSPRYFILILLLSMIPSSIEAREARFARHPAPSPDGSVLAFSWQGDLWVVSSTGGQARRLTVHPGIDRYPVWSQDGRWLAFGSNRHGNYDVYVLPLDASQSPRRLTYASVHDIPLSFSPGGGVLFRTRRQDSIRGMWGLYRVPMEGGTPIRETDFLIRDARLSPSGNRLAFVRGHNKTYRHGYRGSNHRDLWVGEADGTIKRLTTNQGDDDEPSWLNEHTLVFRSERGGHKQLYVLDTESGQTTLLGGTGTWDVRYPRASADGSTLAYAEADGIRVARLRSGGAGKPRQDQRISIDVASDLVQDRIVRKADSSGVDELAISPDGKHAAFLLHGELFLTRIVDKETQEIHKPSTQQITHTAGREQDLSWSPDGKEILFSSDAEGSYDLVVARPLDEAATWAEATEFQLQRLTLDPAEEHGAQFSPDGKTIAFLRGKGNLMLLDRESGDEKALHPNWGGHSFVWSPDAKWIASSFVDQQYNSEVWILPIDGGEPYNVSRHPGDDYSPHWSPDGKRLVWVSSRHANTNDVWGVWLQKQDHERTPADWLAFWDQESKKKKDSDKADDKEPEKKGKKKKGEKDETAKDKELPEVHIDFEDLWRRAVSLTNLSGDEGAPFVSSDGKSVFFLADWEGKRDLLKVRWDGKTPEPVTKGGAAPSQLQMTEDGKTIFYVTKKKIARISPDGKAGDAVPFRAKYEIDRLAERTAVFDEAWRALRDWFYDSDYHGVNWNEQRDRYRPLAKAASSSADFSDVMNLMVGELNASHMGYWNTRGGGGETTGWLGIRIKPTSSTGVEVLHVFPGSPAARTDVGIVVGDTILSVDGEEVEPGVNFYSLFTNTVGESVRLEVLSADKGAEARTINVKPISFGAIRSFVYQDWVKRSGQLVDELSEGRLGYIHIQGMNIPSFESFERDLYAAGHGKEALLIDVRSNGGGWTTDYLLAVLNVRRHAHTLPRDGDPSIKGYPQGRLPLPAWTKPALTLCNEESFSNAEIFSWAFQTLERGQVLGMPTAGGVISTGGRSLLNGGWVRLPLRGWYVAGSDINMENHGAVPDILVQQPMEQDTSPSRDAQLERAVEVMLEGLATDPRTGAW